ncbi:MAG: uroporphyrinogen decarboxylase [Ekhidna sp.]|nr:uroporphyrinogen decarboxylase [Ekhidna sp.]
MSLKNDLILRAARGGKTERTPVWIMRQAGRILPEYRAVRDRLSGFKELVKTPELAAEVTIQPVDILGVDAAIIFSDILVIPEAMGLTYEMVEKKGPYFPQTIHSQSDLLKIETGDPDKRNYVYKAIEITKNKLDGRVPIIGFAGAPWTIFSYMVEGGGSKTFSKARRLLYTNAAMADQLLGMITESTIGYLKHQIQAGAEMVQIFDSWAGILPPDHYTRFGLEYISKICDAISEVPVTVFAKGAWWAMEEINTLSCQTVGLDWNMNPKKAKRKLPNKTLQGNLDPCVFYADDHSIKTEVKKMLHAFEGHPHIANLGHGIYPDTDPEKVKYFVECVKELSHQR